MKRLNRITAVVLTAVVVGVIGMLVWEASQGPTFRAEDHDNYAECMRNIPAEWGPGSLERQGAETACLLINERRMRQGR